MNISILPHFQTRFKTQENNPHNSNVMPSNLSGLMADTVSFSGARRSVSKVADHLEAQVAAECPRLERIATTYLDVLESVAFRLKEKGFSFDRAYCEMNPVKSPESYTSKVVRSGKFKVPDTIRATLYCNNVYDLDSLNTLLVEMKKRGYVLADTEMSVKDLMKRGYIPTANEVENPSIEKIVPDLDIRLEDVSDQVTKLPPELKYSIGKPQKSGYEDIQMRFVRDFDKKKNPIMHELIVLFGPEYSMAKHEESQRVYSHLRLFSELNMKFTDKKIGSHSQKANRYIDLINQMFRGKVSQKLFLNAKNKDLYEIKDEIPITFSETDLSMLDNYFSGLHDRVSSAYKEAKKAASVSDTAKRQLTKELKQDRITLSTIKENLRKTADYYNYQADLQQT